MSTDNLQTLIVTTLKDPVTGIKKVASAALIPFKANPQQVALELEANVPANLFPAVVAELKVAYVLDAFTSIPKGVGSNYDQKIQTEIKNRLLTLKNCFASKLKGNLNG